jgi:hypothetical protein
VAALPFFTEDAGQTRITWQPVVSTEDFVREFTIRAGLQAPVQIR